MTIRPQIAFRNMEAATELEEVINKEARKLDQFYPRIVSCRIAIEAPARKGKVTHRIRLDLSVPGHELVVERNASRHPDQSRKGLVGRDLEIAIHDAFHELRERLQTWAQRLRAPATIAAPDDGALATTFEGKVTKLDPDSGFGFLEAESHGVYFHRNAVVGGHFDRLRIGSKVRFTEEDGEKGPQASTVKLIRGSRQRKEAASTAVLTRRAS